MEQQLREQEGEDRKARMEVMGEQKMHKREVEGMNGRVEDGSMGDSSWGGGA